MVRYKKLIFYNYYLGGGLNNNPYKKEGIFLEYNLNDELFKRTESDYTEIQLRKDICGLIHRLEILFKN